MNDNGSSNSKNWFKIFIGIPFIIEVMIGVSLFLIFRSVLDQYLETISLTLFGEFEQERISNIGFLMLSVLVIIGFVSPCWPELNLPHFRTSPKSAIFLIVLSGIYLLYRCSGDWIFFGWEVIKYADIIILFVSINTFSWVLHLGQWRKYRKNNGFNEDLAYLDEEYSRDIFKDLFGYSDYAQRVSVEILKTFPKQSFTIGINGEWGSGKTSFMNMVAEKVKLSDSSVTLLPFNAWESDGAAQIIPDFLEELRKGLGVGNSYLNRKLLEYSTRISSVDRLGWAKTLTSILRRQPLPISELKKQISLILLRSEKRVLVLIDDLDRLDTEELIQVFKLVRNSVNFRNVIFLLAYDRNYLDQATLKRNSHRADKFIEKIVQVEFSQPIILIDDLREKLKMDLRSVVLSINSIQGRENEFLVEMEKAIDASKTLFINQLRQIDSLKGILTNARDITRLVNSLKVNLNGRLGEVSLHDFLILEILRVKFPKDYFLLQYNHEKLLTHESNHENCFGIKSEEEVKKVLNNDEVWDLLKELFPQHSFTRSDDPYRLRLRYFANYYLYFHTFLRTPRLSQNEYIRFRNGSLIDFKGRLDDWVNKGLEDDVVRIFKSEEIHLFETVQQFKNVIEGIIYLASLPSKHHGFYFVGFRDVNIRYWILDVDHSVSSKFFNSSDDEMKEYLTAVMSQDSRDWNWGKSDLVNKMKQLSESEFFTESYWLFSRDELLDFNIDYLARAIERVEPHRYNRTIAYLMSLCVDSTTKRVSERACKMVFKYCQANSLMLQLFQSFIGRRMVVGAHYSTATYSILESWKDFFEDINLLKAEMDSSEIPYLAEFNGFFNAWENSGGTDSIEYKFSTEFMKDLDEFWKSFNEMPDMPIA